MSQQFDNADQPMTLGGTVSKYQRVKFSGATVVVAGLTDRGIGVAMRGGVSGDVVTIRMDTPGRSTKMIANAAISAGADVYSAANGRVSTSASTAFRVGRAKEASAAAGDRIEIIPTSGDETAVP